MHAAEGSVGVAGPPACRAFDFALLDGAVADAGVWAESLVEGGEVNEGLEDGTDLAAGLGGAVEA